SSETIFVAPDSFDRIVSYTRLVNNEIYDLRVDNDPYDNMLKIIVTMSDENGNYDLPFSTMSDGTVKWITLITAILTNKSIFAVEEPENYLHPLMQKEIVSIVRNSG